MRWLCDEWWKLVNLGDPGGSSGFSRDLGACGYGFGRCVWVHSPEEGSWKSSCAGVSAARLHRVRKRLSKHTAVPLDLRQSQDGVMRPTSCTWSWFLSLPTYKPQVITFGKGGGLFIVPSVGILWFIAADRTNETIPCSESKHLRVCRGSWTNSWGPHPRSPSCFAG